MDWECPNCDAWLKSPTNRMHNCPGLGGLAVYFVAVGTKVKVTAVEREDYIANEIVQTNNEGRPIMSVVTERDDGQDCIVYAPTAVGRLQ